jgi:hypothetical protein
MAVPGLISNWNDDGPLRPSDINWRTLEADMNRSEQSVFDHAFQPEDTPEPRRARRIEAHATSSEMEREIFRSVFPEED